MNELITKMLENPDKAPEIALEINDLITGLQSTVEERESSLEGANKRISELQETNGRLFMRVASGGAEVQQEEEVEELSPFEKAVEEAGYNPADLLDKKGF